MASSRKDKKDSTPEHLPDEVLKKLEASGLLHVNRPKSPSIPPPVPAAASHRTTASSVRTQLPAQPPAQTPPPTQSSVKTPLPTAGGPPSRKMELKGKIQPLLPNLQKLFRLITGGGILPSSVSFENVRINDQGQLVIGQQEIGRVYEGKDGNGISVRIFFSKLNIQDVVPEIVKSRFPMSEAILMIHKTKTKFFVVTEKNVTVGFAKSEEDSPIMMVYGAV